MNRTFKLFKKLVVPLSFTFLILVSACTPAAITGEPFPTTTPSTNPPTSTPAQPVPTKIPTQAPDIVDTPVSNVLTEAARKALAKQLGIDISKITLVSFEEVVWPDSCLGVTRKGVMCAQVITPGYRIVLQAEGQTYEYHTNLSGSAMILASASDVVINLPVITYHREGGIAGFCDDVLIYANGNAKISSCKSAQLVDMSLSVTQLATLAQWRDAFQGFDYQHKDPAVADAMSVSLKFIGNGQNQATDADIQAILSFLSQIAFQYNR